VEGPSCETKEAKGLFSKMAMVDRYEVGLTWIWVHLGRPCWNGRRATTASGGQQRRQRHTAAGSPVTLDLELGARFGRTRS
jgi:hypothetical protein